MSNLRFSHSSSDVHTHPGTDEGARYFFEDDISGRYPNEKVYMVNNFDVRSINASRPGVGKHILNDSEEVMYAGPNFAIRGDGGECRKRD